ncbi:unnamed protein product [Gongylonema pulchrum]|uniref:Ribosomal RNA-processing protein 8 n=1 Tax=Gongylonema pulchrum TaxID=637853 RepID=A0A183DRM9_9BILA|nr:unnamed protein product [Gongylonema pulchrum]
MSGLSKVWSYNPVSSIIHWLRSLAWSGLVIADMGCGDAKISKAMSSLATVHSFDLVPLESGSVDIVVFCLSLMGTDLHEYFREANRLLKNGCVFKSSLCFNKFYTGQEILYIHFFSSR